jgi:hypothetical protein
MPIHSDQNLYPGINAHLNSFLQQEDGGWESFHADHISQLRQALDAVLPSNYYAVSEKSLQVSEMGLNVELSHRTRPDVTVFQTRSLNTLAASPAAVPTATLPLSDVLDEEDDYLSSIVIFEFESGKLPGRPVTRIELLSPANKPGNAYYRQYVAKRRATLQAELCLVEIDYLHETRPLLYQFPSYPEGEEGAFPYLVLVSDPRPKLQEGHLDFYGISIDKPLPLVSIPLAGSDRITLNLNDAYQKTFENARLYRLVVDYAEEPVHFGRYQPDDQMKIRSLLEEIRRTYPSS